MKPVIEQKEHDSTLVGSIEGSDTGLLKIAEYVWGLLQSDRFEHQTVRFKLMKLFVEIFSFDFLCACPDESEETTAVMIPHSFAIFRQLAVSQRLFQLLADPGTSKETAKLVLQALVLVASFRRSFYLKDEDRKQVLFVFLSGTAALVDGFPGSHLIQDRDCLHEVCRLIGRLKTGEAVGDLLELEGFKNFLSAVWSLTQRVAFSGRHEFANSRYYVLNFWAQISLGLSSLNQTSPSPVYLADALRMVVELVVNLLTHSED
ncbi:hypothetical protein EBZ37_09240, partial [bacterium]|nr:hypothetical protein [bacterium]